MAMTGYHPEMGKDVHMFTNQKENICQSGNIFKIP
jgi:hypothetical protein